MKPQQPNNSPPDFDTDLDSDAVWSLLDDATPTDPPPRFVHDTLRRVRLEENEVKFPWWKSLFAPKPMIGVAGAALAAIAITVSLPSEPAPSGKTVVEATEDFDELEDTLATELLSGAAEDPTLLSDEEIVALLY